MIKYVWINLNTGEFSNSWNEFENSWNEEAQQRVQQRAINTEDLKQAEKLNWKCIKYECVNDNDSFQFNKNMKIVTSKRNKTFGD